jgi:hypothetical protein
MGLSGTLCDKLVDLREIGTGKLKHATRVEHFNSSSDVLSQGLQNRHLPFGLSQLGTRYDVKDAGTHKFPNLQEAITNLSTKTGEQASNQESSGLVTDRVKSDSAE